MQVDFAPSLDVAADQVKPCDERPQDVYDRMIGVLRQFSKMDGRFGSTPFAVVITKSDAFGLAKDIEASTPVNGANGNSKGEDPESRAVRQWLIEHGESNLVRSIENDFKKVRYFHCSSLGRLPDASSSPFNPQGVLDPLGWVLRRYDVDLDKGGQSLLASPSSASSGPRAYEVKVGGRSYNGAAISTLWVFATLGLFVFGGWWAVTYPEWSRRSYASSNNNTYYTPTPQPMVGRRGTTTTDVNLRSGPNSGTKKIGLAERGSSIRVLSVASDGSWYEIEVTRHGRTKEDRNSSDRGWMNAKYLALE